MRQQLQIKPEMRTKCSFFQATKIRKGNKLTFPATAASAITLESGGQKRGEDWLGNVIWLEHHRSSSQARFVEANKK